MDQTLKPTGLPTIPRLHALALKKIFDKPNLTKIEDYELAMGVEKHLQILNYMRPEDIEQIHRIVDCLMADEEVDYFHKQKFIIKQAKLDYRKLYSAGLPYLAVYREMTHVGQGT